MAMLGLAGCVSISQRRGKRKQSWWHLGKGPNNHLSRGAGDTCECAAPNTPKAAASEMLFG